MHVPKLKHSALSTKRFNHVITSKLWITSKIILLLLDILDTGVQKMNSIAVRIFDNNQSKTVYEYFYSMCLTDSENAGKAYIFFEKIDSIFQSDGIP